jgi:hypothetical protein
VEPALREVVDEPAVDRAERQLAALGAVARPFDVVEQPRELGAGEVGVEHEARARADHVLGAVGAELRADGRRAPVLPDDRAVERLARLAVPEHRGLALVRDPDRRDVLRPQRGARERLDRRRHLVAQISLASCST